MAKDKNTSSGKISDFDKRISDWEEKMSVAVIDKNPQAIASAKRMIEYWKRKKAE